MNDHSGSAAIAVFLSGSGLLFALVSGNARQIAFSSALLLVSGALLRMSLKG